MYVKTPAKRGGGARTPMIPPSSVKISADGDLAGKLAKLSTQVNKVLNTIEKAVTQSKSSV